MRPNSKYNDMETMTQRNAITANCRYYIDYVYNTDNGVKYWYFIFVRTLDGAILYANDKYNAVVEYGRDMHIQSRDIWEFRHNDIVR